MLGTMLFLASLSAVSAMLYHVEDGDGDFVGRLVREEPGGPDSNGSPPSNASNVSTASNDSTAANASNDSTASNTSNISNGSCTRLRNRGTHFTVKVDVGTPGQSFHVVADTGSSSLIVPSCVCQAVGRCTKNGPCFKGSNKSSTFHMEDGAGSEFLVFSHADVHKRIPVESIEFGSGTIKAVEARDVVTVAGVKTTMKHGLLLMVENLLRFHGVFDGILGMGLPGSSTKRYKELIDVGFLEQAGVERFSVCFNNGADGILRLQQPRAATRMGSIGRMHWGLDFRGISVGVHGSLKSLPFCSGSNPLPEGQSTACGAVPDSGSTVITAPREHLSVLFAEICSQWPRCANFSKVSNVSGHNAFETLVSDCERWRQPVGLEELPPITFHLAGKDGKVHNFTLPGPGYILELAGFTAVKQEDQGDTSTTTKAHMESNDSTNDSNSNSSLLQQGAVYNPSSKEDDDEALHPSMTSIDDPSLDSRDHPDITRLVSRNQARSKGTGQCMQAFEEMAYNTRTNGPIWILGTPIFYQFQVAYDLAEKPPSISFEDKACGVCNDEDKTSLLAESETLNEEMRGRGRQVSRPFMKPTYDFSHGF